MLIDEGLEILSEDEARTLIGSGGVGRVGITMGALPAIFPVNYKVIDGAIVFLTAPGSKFRAATVGAVVAFEADAYDAKDRTGWSVLVVGRAEAVTDIDLSFKVLQAKLEPFANGIRTHLVRIPIELISGRRIVPRARTR